MSTTSTIHVSSSSHRRANTRQLIILLVFLSPLPNPQLWNGQTVGFLQIYESFANGGWWHDPNLLAATGEGSEVEEARGWKGWWNEHIVGFFFLSGPVLNIAY